MKIFVISLVSASKRRQSATAQLHRAGIPFQFFDAIEGSEGFDAYFEGVDWRTYRLNTYRDPLPGEIGCYASHLALWRRAVDINEPILVLEDDFNLEPNFKAALRAVEHLIDTFGFIRLQSFERSMSLRFKPSAPVVSEVNGLDLHYLSNVPLCLLAYAVSPARCRQLVSASRCLTSPVDKFVQRTWEHETPIFALSPASVTISSLAAETTIGNRRTNKKAKVALAFQRARYKIRGELERRRFDKEQLETLRSVADASQKSPARSITPIELR